MAKIILASTSPRRKDILGAICQNFEIISPNAEEISEGEPQEVALINAVRKGQSVNCDCDLLIACDTLVSLDGVIYGKPYTEENAVAMLKKLQGKTHTVTGGVYLRVKGIEYAYTVDSRVKLKPLTDGEIIAYVKNNKPLDKAGAYGIQDNAVTESYEGDYDNIVGLPTDRIKSVIRDLE